MKKKPRKILQVHKQNMCFIVSGLNLPKPKGVKLIAQTKNLGCFCSTENKTITNFAGCE